MARNRTTKAVAQRIDLNYFKRATPFKKARLWLAALAPAIALVWIGWHFWGHDNRVYSSGRLSAAHAVLEKDCAACHVRQAGGFSATAEDSACLACHDAPIHHATKMHANAACADCHLEHRGHVRMAATKNEKCSQCHGELVLTSEGANYARHIRSFQEGHPEFAALRNEGGKSPRDDGTIKVNHELHMKSIRRGPTGPMVQMECGDCHRPAASNAPDWPYGDARYEKATPSYNMKDELLAVSSRGLATPKPASGRERMAPPKFATACAGCHLLTFDKRFEEGVPHDTPQVVRQYLLKKFSEYIAVHPGEAREVRDPQRKLAGRAPGATTLMLSPSQWVAQQVAVSEELLWHKTCLQCHGISNTPLGDVRIARWDAANNRSGGGDESASELAKGAAGALPTIAPAKTTAQWLPHAKFDHDAHRGFSCSGCHLGAASSKETTDVLIPGIATCQKCHAPGPEHAESRCFECHTYHDWEKRKEVKPTFMLSILKGGGT